MGENWLYVSTHRKLFSHRLVDFWIRLDKLDSLEFIQRSNYSGDRSRLNFKDDVGHSGTVIFEDLQNAPEMCVVILQALQLTSNGCHVDPKVKNALKQGANNRRKSRRQERVSEFYMKPSD